MSKKKNNQNVDGTELNDDIVDTEVETDGASEVSEEQVVQEEVVVEESAPVEITPEVKVEASVVDMVDPYPNDDYEDAVPHGAYVAIEGAIDGNKYDKVVARIEKCGLSYVVLAAGIILVGPFDTRDMAFESRKRLFKVGVKGYILEV